MPSQYKVKDSYYFGHELIELILLESIAKFQVLKIFVQKRLEIFLKEY